MSRQKKTVRIASLEQLTAMRNEAGAALFETQAPDSARVVVGLGTCGLAAGAQQVFDAIQEELAQLKLEQVALVRTGCVGICQFEPVVEVYTAQGRTTYVKMTPERARRVVHQHLRGGNPLPEFTIGTQQ